MEAFVNLMNSMNGIVWGPVMLCALVGTGIYFTIRSHGFQFRHFGLIMKETIGKIFVKTEVREGALSPVQAMTTALAGTVGTGSIAGVTSAIAIGGPGAVFWMWLSALFGMCTKFAEVTLAVRYREKNEAGEYVGGAMYYIKNGLGQKWAWLGGLFALFATLASFGIGNMTQINTIASSVGSIFTSFNPELFAPDSGTVHIIYLIVGITVAALTALVLFGGLQSIGKATEAIVPVMALAYIICAMIIVVFNAGNLLPILGQIFRGAFDPASIGGGLAGTGIMTVIQRGIVRGVFSNEAGLGSAPIAHASANTDHPVRQGMFGAFEVFAATLVICTLTAMAVLCSGAAAGAYGNANAGADLTIAAFSTVMGSRIASIVIAICITMFAFSTILSWSLYGTRTVEYLLGSRSILPYKFLFLMIINVVATTKLSTVWLVADNLNALMIIPNLIAILALSQEVIRLVRDFFSEDPQYTTAYLDTVMPDASKSKKERRSAPLPSLSPGRMEQEPLQ